jgi:hypothetical protein
MCGRVQPTTLQWVWILLGAVAALTAALAYMNHV